MVGCWLLAIGYWLLAVGYWLLAISGLVLAPLREFGASGLGWRPNG
jgi:hypothetical protein